MDPLLAFIHQFPLGVSPGEIERALAIPRTTLNRQLNTAVDQGRIRRLGRGAATRYQSADPHVALRAYFERPYTERPLARFDERRLDPTPGLPLDRLQVLPSEVTHILDRRELAKFLIDFSCASSLLEGGTYSFLDTQALLDYGEPAEGKPLADAFLVLNHKDAFEYLYDHMSLDSIFEVHARLTNDHARPELKNAPHFLEKDFRGVVREFTDIDIAQSTYMPPFRPGTGYLGRALEQILETSKQIDHPLQAAFYLMTRIAYLQPFKDGNKRTSRAICNVPLIQAQMPPISFVEFNKRDYIISMLAFYELGDLSLAATSFLSAYQKSIARLRVNPKPS
jgi:Fic family protein